MDQDAVLIAVDETANPQPPPTGVNAAFVTLDPETEWSAEVIVSGEGDSITTEKIMGVHPVGSNEALFDFSSSSAVPTSPPSTAAAARFAGRQRVRNQRAGRRHCCTMRRAPCRWF
jgi:hypothetical protein